MDSDYLKLCILILRDKTNYLKTITILNYAYKLCVQF